MSASRDEIIMYIENRLVYCMVWEYIGIDCMVFDWVKLNRNSLDRIESNRVGSDWIGLDFIELP